METSLKRIKRAARAELRIHKKLFFIIQILLVVAALIYGFDMYVSDGNYYDYDIYFEQYASLSGFGTILFGAAVLCGFIAVINLFKDMHSVQTADVQLSLPLSAGERYASKIAALFVMHILPVVVFLLIGFGLTVLDSGALPCVINLNERFIVLMIGWALFTDAVTLFCVCCCGTFAESVYITLITLGIFSVLPWAFFEQVVSAFSGLNTFDTGKYFGWWTYSTVMLCDESDFAGAGSSLFFLENTVSCIISVLLMIAVFFIYRRRDERTVGKPIVYKLFFELFMFLGLVMAFTTFLFSSGMALIGLAVALVIYLIIRIVVSRAKVKFTDVLVWLLKYAVSLAVFVGICAVGYITDGFGYKNYIPHDDRCPDFDVEVRFYGTDSDRYDWFETDPNSSVSYSEMESMLKEIREDCKGGKSLNDFLHRVFGYNSDDDDYDVEVGVWVNGRDDYDNSSYYFNQWFEVDSETADALNEKLKQNENLSAVSDDYYYEYEE